jgi:hypothetical protein
MMIRTATTTRVASWLASACLAHDGDDGQGRPYTTTTMNGAAGADDGAPRSSNRRGRASRAVTMALLLMMVAGSSCVYYASTLFILADEGQGQVHEQQDDEKNTEREHAHASVRRSSSADAATGTDRRLLGGSKNTSPRWKIMEEKGHEKMATLKEEWSKYSIARMSDSGHDDSYPVRPFFGIESQVHVLQIGDDKYKEKHRDASSLNELWAKCAGYQYHFKPFNNSMNSDKDNNDDTIRKNKDNKAGSSSADCVYTQKVKVIRDFFVNDVRTNDWMIFVDLDAHFQAPSCDELEKILWRQQHLYNRHHDDSTPGTGTSTTSTNNEYDHQPCEVIAHTCSKGINSGIFLMKATDQTRELMEAWYRHQHNAGFCTGPGDQFALQEVMLEYYRMDDYSLDECLKFGSGPKTFSGRGRCSAQKLNVQKTKSFDRLPEFMKRSDRFETIPLVGTNVCFFDCDSAHPLQCHDCDHDKPACLKRQPLFHHHWHFMEEASINF